MSTRTLGLCKDGLWFVYRYETGQEDDLVEELMRQADEPTCPLGWIDAAELSVRATNLAARDAVADLLDDNPETPQLPFVKEG